MIGALLIWRPSCAKLMTDEELKDALDQGIDALAKAQKSLDPVDLQQCICTLETIATKLRNYE